MEDHRRVKSFLFLEHNKKAKSEHLYHCRGTKLCTPPIPCTSYTTAAAFQPPLGGLRAALQPDACLGARSHGTKQGTAGPYLCRRCRPAGGRRRAEAAPGPPSLQDTGRGSARAAGPGRTRTPRASPHSPALRRPPGRAAERSGLPPPERPR